MRLLQEHLEFFNDFFTIAILNYVVDCQYRRHNKNSIHQMWKPLKNVIVYIFKK